MKSVIRENKVYTLDSERGKVSYLMRQGSDLVRKVMSEAGALSLMNEGRLSISEDQPGYPIAVNGRYFFPGEVHEKENI